MHAILQTSIAEPRPACMLSHLSSPRYLVENCNVKMQMPGASFDMHESLHIPTIQMVLVNARISDLVALVCSLAALAGYGTDFASCQS